MAAKKIAVALNISYDEWIASPLQFGKGIITEGDVYLVNFVFTSDIDFLGFEVAFIDNTVEAGRLLDKAFGL